MLALWLQEVIAGTSTGNIYRLDASSLANLDATGAPDATKPLLASHSKPISCLSFGDSSEWFVTVRARRPRATQAAMRPRRRATR